MGQIYRRSTLLSGGVNPNLAVDGSVTPVTFDLSFLTFQSYDIRAVQIYIEAKGRFKSINDFMTVPALTNGFQLNVQSINESFISNTFRTNRDLSLIFPTEFNQLGNKLIFNSTFAGKDKPLFVIEESATVEIVVSDDLTDIDFILVLVEGTIIE